MGGFAGICPAQQPPQAEEINTFDFFGRAAYEYDSNLFKLADGQPVTESPDSSSRSDHVRILTAGLRLDKPFSQQRFRVNASAVQNRYNDHDFLDHTAKNYLLAWDWAVTPRVTGTMYSDQEEGLADTGSFRNQGVRNIRTVRNQRFEASWWMHSNWYLLGEVGKEKRLYEEEFDDDPSFEADRRGAGVRYESRAGRQITAKWWQRDGDFIHRALEPANFDDNAFEQNNYELKLNYPFGDSSRIHASVGYVDQDYPHVDELDFSGGTSALRLDWGLTAKVRLYLGYARDVQSWQTGDGSYAKLDTFSVGADWAFTAKQTLALRLEDQKRKQGGRLPGADEPLRDDRSKGATLSWTWLPRQNTEVMANLRYQERESNVDEFDYDVHGFSLSVQQMF